MSENEFKPDDAGLLVPYLSVSDPAASLDFYERVFGFKRSGALKNEKGEIVHAEMKHEGQMIIMLGGLVSGDLRHPHKAGLRHL